MQGQAVQVLELVVKDAIDAAVKGRLEYNPATKRMHLVKRPPSALAVQAANAILDRTGLSPEVVTQETLGPREEVKRFIVEFVSSPISEPLPPPVRRLAAAFDESEIIDADVISDGN